MPPFLLIPLLIFFGLLLLPMVGFIFLVIHLIKKSNSTIYYYIPKIDKLQCKIVS